MNDVVSIVPGRYSADLREVNAANVYVDHSAVTPTPDGAGPFETAIVPGMYSNRLRFNNDYETGDVSMYQGASLDLKFQDSSLVDSVSGQQLVTFTRASTGTYIGSDGLIKTAAVDEARITHDPTTGRRLGLLVEEARTNLWAWSNSAVNGETWNNTLLASTAGEPDPAGGTSAILASDIGNATGSTYYQRLGVASLSAGTTVSYSIFIKPIDLPNSLVQLYMYSNGTADYCSASFVTSGTTFTGAITPSQGGTGSVVSTKLETLSNGWYRLTLTGIASTVTQSDLRTRVNIGNYTRVDGTPRFVWYGAQLEEGSFPTSYIPTTGTTVTRTADIATITGTNFSSWYRQDEFSAYGEGTSAGNSVFTSSAILSADDGTNNERWRIAHLSTSRAQSTVVSGGASQGSPQVLGVPAGQTVKVAAGSSVNYFTCKANGLDELTTVTSGVMPAGIDRATIGNAIAGAGYWNGTISRLAYWGQRLPDSTLQALTR